MAERSAYTELSELSERYPYSLPLITRQLSLNPTRVEIHKQRDLCRVERRHGKYGGYRKDILKENLTDRDEMFLICGICKGIMRESCLTSSGEQFCSCCEVLSLSKPSYQPGYTGNIWLSEFPKHIPNEVVRKMVNLLKCSCPLLERGCEWLGTLKDCEEHLDTCGYVQAQCTLGCGAVIHRNKLRAHEEDNCPNRKVKCEHCNQYFTFRDLTTHHKECPKMELSCELKCGVVMCREDMEQHLKRECGMVIEMCTLGCGTAIHRNKLRAHKEDNCPNRKVKCEHCIQYLTFRDLTTHHKECPKMEVSCELKCGVVMCREDMEQHLELECGMVVETCELGCGMKMIRNELKIHVTDTCVQRLIQCEHCREDIKFCDTTTHLEVCPKKKVSCELCDKKMCREDMEQHLKLECGMMVEMCKLGCGMKMTRNELKLHLTDTCVQRLIQCEHCREDIKFCDTTTHLEVCPKKKVSCELCDKTMCREDIAQHLEVECVEKVIMCPFAKYNCEVTSIKRKYLSQHLEEKETNHLGLKLNAMEDIILKQSEQIIRISRMSEHINTLRSMSKITMLDWNIESLSKFIQINHIPEQRNIFGINLSIHFLKEHIYVSYPRTHGYSKSFSAKYLILLYSTIRCKVVKQYDCDRVDVHDMRYLGEYEKCQIARILKSDAKELSRIGSANKLILEMYITKL